MNKNLIRKEIDFLGKKLSFETGKLAGMVNMSVTAQWGDSVVLVTVASKATVKPAYFPLQVVYIEKMYASGSIKGSRFVKRDGRSTDEARIRGRVIDHAIRPMFPSDFMDEVQVVVTVLSLDKECDVHFLAMNAVSAALSASNVPFGEPSVSVKVGYIEGEYVLNPSDQQLHSESALNMVVSFVGADKKYLALEAEADILPEDKIMGALEFGRNNVDELFKLVTDFAKEVNPEGTKYEYNPVALDADMVSKLEPLFKQPVYDMMRAGDDKEQMLPKQIALFKQAQEKFGEEYSSDEMLEVFHLFQKNALQKLLLDDGQRPDGRGIHDVRDISAELGLLPRVHGSALFNRGVTQVLSTITLGSPGDEIIQEDMYGERTKRYMHFYNFLPYAGGETGRMNGYAGNREIGHGMIGENALRPVLPDQADFPYTIIVTSETLASSGSTSMAATCASTLALMDAGVPIKDLVAGIGVGLLANDDFSKSLIMTDLAYMEDAYGHLDFKMTGTKDGVTAIQSDMKLQGIPFDLLPKIIEQSKEARLKVLSYMESVISKPREQLSKYAPKLVTFMIDPEKIGLVIGSGGKTIKGIQEEFGVHIHIEDDGQIMITSEEDGDIHAAQKRVTEMVVDVEVGQTYEGVVTGLLDFGALVEVMPGKVGLLHISEITNGYVEKVTDHIKDGDTIKVKVLDVGDNGKISLSMKALEKKTE